MRGQVSRWWFVSLLADGVLNLAFSEWVADSLFTSKDLAKLNNGDPISTCVVSFDMSSIDDDSELVEMGEGVDLDSPWVVATLSESVDFDNYTCITH